MAKVSKFDRVLQHAREVKARHEDDLLRRPGVVGVGVGLRRSGGTLTDEVAIVVMVRNRAEIDALGPEYALPDEIEGVPVDIQETGEISAH